MAEEEGDAREDAGEKKPTFRMLHRAVLEASANYQQLPQESLAREPMLFYLDKLSDQALLAAGWEATINISGSPSADNGPLIAKIKRREWTQEQKDAASQRMTERMAAKKQAQAGIIK